MFKFSRTRILPLFLQKRITIAALARLAGVSHQATQRALEGERVSAVIVSKIADALEIDAASYLEPPSRAI